VHQKKIPGFVHPRKKKEGDPPKVGLSGFQIVRAGGGKRV